MKFNNYLNESRPQPIPTLQFKRALENFAKETFFNKEKYNFEMKNNYYEDSFSYDEWLNFKLYSNWFVEISGKSIRLTFNNFLIKQFFKKWDGNEILDFFTKKFYKQGWYASELKPTKIIFSPQYNEQIFNLPSFIYHFSWSWNKKSILKKGIIPGSRETDLTFKYKNKVFVGLSYNLSSIKTLANIIGNQEVEYGKEIQEMPIVVFKIDTSKLLKGTKFYKDNQGTFKDFFAAWTPTRIPSNALTIIYEDKIDDEI